MQLNFLQYGVVAVATLAIIATGRDLRPSQHGLSYQLGASSPAAEGTRSFFSSTTSSVTIPEARSVGNQTWWSIDGDARSRDFRRDHVRLGLIVATAVCGFAGVVLLVVSGIVFIVRRRKRMSEAERPSSNSELHQVNVK